MNLENNKKIRPQPDGENAFPRAGGEADGPRAQFSFLPVSLLDRPVGSQMRQIHTDYPLPVLDMNGPRSLLGRDPGAEWQERVREP